MVVLNRMSRYHLAIEALRRSRRAPRRRAEHILACEQAIARHRAYVLEHFEDLPEIQSWTWKG